MKQLSCAYCKHFNNCTDSKSISDGFNCHRFTILPCLRRWYYGAIGEVVVNSLASLGQNAIQPSLSTEEVYEAWQELEQAWHKTLDAQELPDEYCSTIELKIEKI